MDSQVREDQWAEVVNWGDPPTYQAAYSEISNDTSNPRTLITPPRNSTRVFAGDYIMAFSIAAYVLPLCMLLSAVSFQEETASFRYMGCLFATVLFVALFRNIAWMVGFLIGGWWEAWTAGYAYGREVEQRRKEENEVTKGT